MSDPSYVLLYVKSPSASVRFYTDILGKNPVEDSPTFALFVLDSGVKLGLWKADTVEPAATSVGGSEIAFAVDGEEAVRAQHRLWKTKGLSMVQAPTPMDFGYTFVALDPDGHRLRVFAPAVP